ncbi:MAG: hypothetical protein ACR2NU_14450 [Aeoliella sp.]
MAMFQFIQDFDAGREILIRGRYGMIETVGGRLNCITLRPWPKLISWPEVWPVRLKFHDRGPVDRCRLYYNQPRGMPNFLALKYVVSTPGTQYATFRAALTVLDAIAELKRTDAILCDAANSRLSDRFMNRLGWEAHKPQRWHRNYIRRFYGEYPAG